MIRGVVLDASVIEAFGRLDIDGALAIDRVDTRANAIMIPVAALTEALTRLETSEEAERALFLVGFGVALTADLTAAIADRVAIAVREAGEAKTSFGMAHSAVVARDRGWPVLTADPGPWRAAYPDVTVDDIRPE